MPYRILIVDDSRVMREMIQRTVKLSGIEVQSIEQAADGRQALEKMRAQPFDLVLLDINMPVMDGEQVLAQIRADANLRHIPVIIASTESSDTRIRRLRLMGAEFIHKPFRPEDLATLVVKIAAPQG
jgi:two-component system chemotaxis response regulator CheY